MNLNLNFSRVRLIATREWLQKIKTRSFVIATIIQSLIILGLIVGPVVLSSFFGDDDGSDAAVVRVISDEGSALVADTLSGFLAQLGGEESVVFEPADANADPAAMLDESNVDGVLEIGRSAQGDLTYSYTSEDGDYDTAAVTTYAAAAALALRDRLERSGLSEQEIQTAISPPSFAFQATSGEDAGNDGTEDAIRYAAGYVIAVVMYMVVLVYGMWVAQGVVEEKSSRIMEIMINAATPGELMFGKVLGIGLAGLTQILPMLLIGVIGLFSQERLAEALDVSGIDLGSMDLGALSITISVYFLVFFVLGFILYAALYAGVGSLVSRQEEVQQVMTPMTMFVIAGFFGALFTLNSPDSIVARVVSIFPLTSPLAMVPRILVGDPAAWEIALSLVLLAVTAVLAVLLAGRIYRMGVLMYGQKPSFRVIFRRDTVTAAR